ncbi:hypothetical protein PHET_05629 [Paragonimus heterotremus]|uniref:Uncharacterized protein n=1 Tax=Paragonimus heterotremus TaxID=100268 RepID=A0A8J4WI38_9TREM|nr:hypothetical protein PHET_05629 [Paragonimus heterotremus]
MVLNASTISPRWKQTKIILRSLDPSKSLGLDGRRAALVRPLAEVLALKQEGVLQDGKVATEVAILFPLT